MTETTGIPDKASGRADYGEIGATLGKAMIVGLATGGLTLPPVIANAGDPATVTSTATTVKPDFTRKELLTILGTASGVIGDFEGSLPKKYTEGWAKFFAPTNWQA